jgi:LPS-assembly protein
MFRIFKTLILIFSISICFYCLSFCQDVDLSADNLEYFEIKSLVTADGNVVVDWQGKKIYADHIEFLIDKKILNATGHVKVEEAGTVLVADSVSYRYNEDTGDLKQVFSYSSFVFMRAKAMEGKDKKTFEINNVKFSTCDLEEPHTHFRAKRGRLVLDKRITIYNAIFYVGKVPVFYLPIVTKSLKGKRGFGTDFRIKFKPGYEQLEGFTLETGIGCSLSENSFGEFLYDYHGKRGNGYGGSFNYVTDNINANLHLYTIKDLIDNQEVWEIRPNYFQRLNKNWTIRSQVNLKNSRTFNNIYNQSNWNGVENWIQSYFTLTRQSSRACLLLNTEYDVHYDNLTLQYKPYLIKLPSLQWDFYSRKTFLDIMYRTCFQFNHNYGRHRLREYFYRDTALAKLNLTRDFKLSKRLVLKPSLDLIENWYDIDTSKNYNNSFFTQYGVSLNTRYRLTSWIDLNAKYSYMGRTQPNYFKLDKNANDYGIELNNVALSNFMFVGDRTTVRNSITYDFRYNRRILNKKWWSPLVTEVTWTPKYNITVLMQESHLVEPFRFDAFQLDAKIGHLKKAIFKYSLLYQHYNDPLMEYKNNEIDNILGIAFWVTPKWRIDYKITTSVTIDLKYFTLDTHRLLIYRDLHCYNLGIILNKNAQEDRIDFKFDLKTNMPFSKSNQNFGYDNPEEMFYPWEDEFPRGL